MSLTIRVNQVRYLVNIESEMFERDVRQILKSIGTVGVELRYTYSDIEDVEDDVYTWYEKSRRSDGGWHRGGKEDTTVLRVMGEMGLIELKLPESKVSMTERGKRINEDRLIWDPERWWLEATERQVKQAREDRSQAAINHYGVDVTKPYVELNETPEDIPE